MTKCERCKKNFKPTRSWSKYCSDKCRKKANTIRVTRYRMKHDPLKVKTIEEMRTKEPYRKNYQKIMDALKTGVKITWDDLQKETELSSDTLSRYLKVLRKLGAVEKEDLSLSENYRFEPMKLRERDIIMDTDFEHIFFSPPNYNYTFYNPGIPAGRIRYNVKDFDQRSKNVKKHLEKAELNWLKMLREARDSHVEKLWNEKILLNKELHVLSKFLFSLVMIYEIEEFRIWSHSKKSPNQLWKILIDIHEKASDRYLKERYPGVTQSQMADLDMIVDRDYTLKNDFFEQLEHEIRFYLDPSLLEHIIVVDMPGLGLTRHKDLAEAGIFDSFVVDRDKPISKQRVRKEKLSEEQPAYNAEKIKYLVPKWMETPLDKKLYVTPPFFKSFFKSSEKDMINLGFEPKDQDNRLEGFYKRLDEMATILKIPSLPDDLDALLSKEGDV